MHIIYIHLYSPELLGKLDMIEVCSYIQFSDVLVATFINTVTVKCCVSNNQPPKQTFPPSRKLFLGCVRLPKSLTFCFSALASATD